MLSTGFARCMSFNRTLHRRRCCTFVLHILRWREGTRGGGGQPAFQVCSGAFRRDRKGSLVLSFDVDDRQRTAPDGGE